jgi:hypothetical protein
MLVHSRSMLEAVVVTLERHQLMLEVKFTNSASLLCGLKSFFLAQSFNAGGGGLGASGSSANAASQTFNGEFT